ncbi:MAG: glycosyltransferase family 4 protein [Candidatus Kapabacteria bacterium]|nr:glycosyltransferase family 4 protein [Candidatus Kapabacteria bacterium]
MRKLLIIAYYFPPSGGSGVQRVLKHVKYLPEFGWQPVVLTVSNGLFPARDESLLSQVPDSTIVYKSETYEPYNIYRKLTGKKQGVAIDVNTIWKENEKLSFKEAFANFIRATFFIPDARVGWLATAGNAIKKIMAEHKIDAIYSSSPPYTCSIIARNAKRKYNLPWIAGFRDPWTEFITQPVRWWLPALVDRHFERTVFNEADAVECAWLGIIKDALHKYPQLDKNKFFHIPNGFDSEDFPKCLTQTHSNNSVIPANAGIPNGSMEGDSCIRRNDMLEKGKFTITYTGAMYGRRNPETFLQAIESLIQRNEVNPDEIKLKFVGRFGADIEKMFNSVSFPNSIESIPYLPHGESIKQLIESDVTLLIVDSTKESEEIVPGKVYEYVGLRKPVIAIAPPQSAIAVLMTETGCGRCAAQEDIESIAQIFKQYYQNWKNSSALIVPDDDAINRYERRTGAKSLSDLMNIYVK